MTVWWGGKDVSGFISHLRSRGVLNDASTGRIMAAIDATGHGTDTVLTELGLVREDVFAREVAAYLDAAFVEDPLQDVDLEASHAIGLGFLTNRAALPLRGPAGRLRLVIADPFDSGTLDMLAYHADRGLDPEIATRSAIVTAVAALGRRADADDAIDPSAGAFEGDIERLRDFAQQAPIVRLVARIAQFAVDEGATDIHFEPFEHVLNVRIRVDGRLRPVETVSIDLLPGIATRIKILAGLDISERRVPQDGRMRFVIRGQEIDLRVSVVPTIDGETIALRILDRSTVALDFTALGFDAAGRERMSRLTQTPNGIVLVTGPTGSGKTTTLYALIAILNQAHVKIFTVEDPVEYRMTGVTQLQTNTATGLTFARALRSVLRQDPDIVLVGEIRDRETAEIAMQAALTGHLVLSTLHTNSAVGAITRLRDMGLENYLIAATVKGVLGQRLLRRACVCASTGDLGHCTECGGAGYKGRTVAYEMMDVTPAVARQIAGGSSEDEIEHALGDFTSLARYAIALARDGVTTLEEVARVVRLTAGQNP